MASPNRSVIVSRRAIGVVGTVLPVSALRPPTPPSVATACGPSKYTQSVRKPSTRAPPARSSLYSANSFRRAMPRTIACTGRKVIASGDARFSVVSQASSENLTAVPGYMRAMHSSRAQTVVVTRSVFLPSRPIALLTMAFLWSSCSATAASKSRAISRRATLRTLMTSSRATTRMLTCFRAYASSWPNISVVPE